MNPLNISTVSTPEIPLANSQNNSRLSNYPNSPKQANASYAPKKSFIQKRTGSFRKEQQQTLMTHKTIAQLSEEQLRIDMIIKILQRHTTVSQDDMEESRIVHYLREVKFFKELQIKDSVILDLIQVMHHEHFKKDEYVFKHNQEGDKFYIMLRGEAAVLLPYYLNNEGEAVKYVEGEEQFEVVDEDNTLIAAMKNTQKMSGEGVIQSVPLVTKSTFSRSQTLGKNDSESPNSQKDVVTPNSGNLVLSTFKKQATIAQKANVFGKGSPLKKNDDNKPKGNPLQKQITKNNSGLQITESPKNATSKFAMKRLSSGSNGLSQISSVGSSQDSNAQQMTEAGILQAGDGFGELALITPGNIMRQASIKCRTECHMASIAKNEYIRIIKRLEERIKEEWLNFYRSTPYFTHWSKSMLQKLLYAFKPTKCKKDQIIIQEGEQEDQDIRYLYLIKEGEFEVIKRVKTDPRVLDKNEGTIDVHKFMDNKYGPLPEPDPNQAKTEFADSEKHLDLDGELTGQDGYDKPRFLAPRKAIAMQATTLHPKQLLKQTDVSFMLLARGQIFGEEALLTDCDPLYSIKCKSAVGEILLINELEFVKRLKSNAKTLRVLEANCQQKSQALINLLLNNKSYLNMNTALKAMEMDAKVQDNLNQANKELQEMKQASMMRMQKSIQQMKQQSVAVDTQSDQASIMILRNELSSDRHVPQKAEEQHVTIPTPIIEVSVKEEPRRKALFEMRNALLNKNEIDMRRHMTEAVKDYPNVKEQRKIVINQVNYIQDQRNQVLSHQHQQQQLLNPNSSIASSLAFRSESPSANFQRELGKSLANSMNKRELIDIMKTKIIRATFRDYKNPPQDHIKLIDRFIQSDIVKKYNNPKKKHYMSSRITDAIEQTDGIIITPRNVIQRGGQMRRLQMNSRDITHIDNDRLFKTNVVASPSDILPKYFGQGHLTSSYVDTNCSSDLTKILNKPSNSNKYMNVAKTKQLSTTVRLSQQFSNRISTARQSTIYQKSFQIGKNNMMFEDVVNFQ